MSPIVITLFHVLWFTLSAFLLLNLVVGAIVNNYQLAIQEAEEEEKKEREEKKKKEREEKKKAKEEALA